MRARGTGGRNHVRPPAPAVVLWRGSAKPLDERWVEGHADGLGLPRMAGVVTVTHRHLACVVADRRHLAEAPAAAGVVPDPHRLPDCQLHLCLLVRVNRAAQAH